MGLDFNVLSLVSLIASDMSYKGKKTVVGELLHTYQDSEPENEWRFPTKLLSQIQRPGADHVVEPLMQWEEFGSGASKFPEYALTNWQVLARLDGKLNNEPDGFGATIFASKIPDANGNSNERSR